MYKIANIVAGGTAFVLVVLFVAVFGLAMGEDSAGGRIGGAGSWGVQDHHLPQPVIRNDFNLIGTDEDKQVVRTR
jgi:hypothetical protein